MKIQNLFFSLILFSQMSFAQDLWGRLGPKLLGEWSGPWFDGISYGDTYTIEDNPRRFVETIYRQVGGEDTPNIPLETKCLIKREGRPLVEKCSQIDLSADGFCRIGTHQSDYILSYQMTAVELVESEENDPHCENFIELEEQSLGRVYSHPFSILSSGDLRFYGDEIFRQVF